MEYTVYRQGEPITFNTELDEGQAAKILREQKAPNVFRDSLLASYAGRGLSERQRGWFLYLAQEVLDKEDRVARKQYGPYKEIADLFNRVPLSRFQLRTETLTLSKASGKGSNPGCIYINSGNIYVGKIDALGFASLNAANVEWLRLSGALDDITRALDDIARDSIGAALRYGRETSICSCCGRALSDPVSVYGGIGPLCLERLAGKAARREMERAHAEGGVTPLEEILARAGLLGRRVVGVGKAEEVKAEVRRDDYSSEQDFLLASAISKL